MHNSQLPTTNSRCSLAIRPTLFITRHRLHLTLLTAMVILLMCPSCRPAAHYHHYESTAPRGWSLDDSIHFEVPPVPSDGFYQEQLGLRITRSYPFRALHVIVEQQILDSVGSHISAVTRNDTLVCPLIDDHGNTLRRGISHIQYTAPLPLLQLRRGQWLHVIVHHDMKRETLPGITDVGLRITRSP